MNQNNTHSKEKHCYYCVNALKDVEYKDVQVLQKFISSYGKIAPTRRSGLCSKHQRKVAKAIKRARFMALLPYTSR